MYVLNEFLIADCSCTKKYFWKTLIEVYGSYLYASFGTFCVQIGQFFETRLIFKYSEEFRIRRHFPSKTANCRFSNILQRLTVPQKIGQFGRKRWQKKRKDKISNFCKNFFKNILFGCQNFGQYICMLCPGRFILIESVS